MGLELGCYEQLLTVNPIEMGSTPTVGEHTAQFTAIRRYGKSCGDVAVPRILHAGQKEYALAVPAVEYVIEPHFLVAYFFGQGIGLENLIQGGDERVFAAFQVHRV